MGVSASVYVGTIAAGKDEAWDFDRPLGSKHPVCYRGLPPAKNEVWDLDRLLGRSSFVCSPKPYHLCCSPGLPLGLIMFFCFRGLPLGLEVHPQLA